MIRKRCGAMTQQTQTDLELARLEEALAEVQAAKRAITTENAVQIQFEGRSIVRPPLDVLDREEGRLKNLINDRRARALGGDWVFGRRVEYT